MSFVRGAVVSYSSTQHIFRSRVLHGGTTRQENQVGPEAALRRVPQVPHAIGTLLLIFGVPIRTLPPLNGE